MRRSLALLCASASLLTTPALAAGSINNPTTDAGQILSGVLAVARGGTGVATSTGSGSVVLSTSPTLVTPTLGAATVTSVTSTGAMTISASGGALSFQTNGFGAWNIDASQTLQPSSDNAFNFGSLTARAKNGWFSGFQTSNYTTQSGTTYTISATDSTVILTNAATVTLTLPAPASFTGRIMRLKTTGGGAVISAGSNVVPLAGGAAGTAILAVTAGKWAELQSDGTNWIVIAAN